MNGVGAPHLEEFCRMLRSTNGFGVLHLSLPKKAQLIKQTF